MKWVEKSSIEKIRRILEISERERHCQVLLTRENISAVRNNLAPHTLPVIPRPLPSMSWRGNTSCLRMYSVLLLAMLVLPGIW